MIITVEFSILWPPISTIKAIMRDLPDHFTEKALINLEEDIVQEIVCVYEDAELIGFLIYKVEEKEAELLWMAISKEFQGRGYGESLLNFLEGLMKERSVNTLILKTLDDSANYPPYKQTTRFYRKNGFKKVKFIEVIPEWGPGNPCAVYEKKLD